MAQPPAKTGNAEVAAFLARVAAMPAVRTAGVPGRLLFAMDATASRQPSWDQACHLQAGMFQAAATVGSLAVSLAYYRGYGEFAATPFLTDAAEVTQRMTGVRCLAGRTQILRVLNHTLAETKRSRIHALVFVGDAVEEEADLLCHTAGELGMHGTPVFVFHEGGAPAPAAVLRQIARLSGGAYAPFDAGSAAALQELLRAVAVFAAGGRAALAALAGPQARRIAGQLPAPKR